MLSRNDGPVRVLVEVVPTASLLSAQSEEPLAGRLDLARDRAGTARSSDVQVALVH